MPSLIAAAARGLETAPDQSAADRLRYRLFPISSGSARRPRILIPLVANGYHLAHESERWCGRRRSAAIQGEVW